MTLGLDLLVGVLLFAGCLVSLVGAVGILRLPDIFARMHGAGMIDTLGAGLVLLALAIEAGFGLIAVKLGLIFLFIFFTSPSTTHALARAALHGGLAPKTNSAPTGGDAPSNN